MFRGAMMPPRVLHALAWPGELAGAPRSMEESLAALRAAGVHPMAWIAPGSRPFPSPVKQRLIDRGVQVFERTSDTSLDALAVRDLSARLRALGPGAVLHTHGERALLWGLAAARLARARHVHTQHGFVANDPRGRVRVAAARRLFRGVDALIATHASDAEGLPGAVVVPNCLDPERVRRRAPDRAEARRSLGLRDDERCYLYLGRLSLEKGADALGVVQAELEKASAAARLYVAGGGPLAHGVDAMEDVRLLGRREDPELLLTAADVLIMPSRREGLPMVALEAAALGLPVAAFAVGGLADQGLAETVRPDDVRGLVQAALRLVREPPARDAALARSRAALDRFAPTTHGEALLRIYASAP
jgi:glycosyltransferase involved in cell wall biosynthesis